MNLTCKMMVPTQPEVGDADRHPPPHQCRRPIYADGYCATHSAKYQEQRKAERAARDALYEERATRRSAPIDAAIVLLVKSGYRVEKLMYQKETK